MKVYIETVTEFNLLSTDLSFQPYYAPDSTTICTAVRTDLTLSKVRELLGAELDMLDDADPVYLLVSYLLAHSPGEEESGTDVFYYWGDLHVV